MPSSSFVKNTALRKIIFFGLPIATIFLLAVFVFWPGGVWAQTTTAGNLGAVGAAAGFGKANIYQLVGKILRVVFLTLGMITIGLTVYGGFVWMTARGEPAQVEKAKDILRNGVIGLMIVFAAFGVTEFIIARLLSNGFISAPAGSLSSDDKYLETFNGGSALGTVVKWHDPPNGAQNVPRDHAIQVQFKFPIDPASLIDAKSAQAYFVDTKDENGNAVKLLAGGPINPDAIIVYPVKTGKTGALKSEQLFAMVGENGKDSTIFTFNLNGVYLGSETEAMDYVVELTNSIEKLKPSGVSAFSGYGNGYSWRFNVGTALDLTSPRVVDAKPIANGTYPKNVVVRLTFSEPINLASAVGVYDPDKNHNFTNIVATDSTGKILIGKWAVAGAFNVVEFTPFNECGLNSCGQKIFCLPENIKIEVRAKAGVLQEVGKPKIKFTQGYTGVADPSNNALDGGGLEGAKPWSTNGGVPKGSPDDDFYYSLSTNSELKSSAPQILSVEPAIGASSLSEPAMKATTDVSVTFDSLMKMTSFDDNIILKAQNPKAQVGFAPLGVDIKVKDQSGADVPVTKAQISHLPFANNQAYSPWVKAGVVDEYQNCFSPASGWNAQQKILCKPDQQVVNKTCCNGLPASNDCELLKYGAVK